MEKLKNMINGYVLNREQLTCLFVLIDIRHDPQKVDMEFIHFLGCHGVPFGLVFTKADKLGPIAGKKMVAAYKEELSKLWEELPPIFVTSSSDFRGREELLDYIESINKSL